MNPYKAEELFRAYGEALDRFTEATAIRSEDMPKEESMSDAVKASGGGFKAPPVLGYTDQSEANKLLVNEGKELEERVLRYLDKVSGTLAGETTVPARAWALGKSHIQTGFMWTFRAVFNPGRIALPEDSANPKP